MKPLSARHLLQRCRPARQLLHRSEERLGAAVLEGLLDPLVQADRLARTPAQESAEDMRRRLVAWGRCQAAAETYHGLLRRSGGWLRP